MTNFTVPALVGDSLTITIVGSGTVHFLNYTLSATSTITHLPSGSYSINSVPASGGYFGGYVTSGAVAMDAAGTPWNSFRLSGTAGLTANFVLVSPPTVGVHFSSPGSHGTVAVSPGFYLPTVATYPGQIIAQYAPVGSHGYADGATINLVPGMYSIQALPSVGYNFTGWTYTGGAYVFAPHTNYTWLNVSVVGGPSTLTGNFAQTTMMDTVWLESVPTTGGSITFGGTTYPSGTILTVPDGTYTVTADPNASYSFETWSYLWSASMSYFASTTQVVLQNGTSWVYALFHSTPSVTLAVAGTGAGAIAFNGTVHSGMVSLSQVEDTTYPIVAAPGAGSTFSGWAVSDPTNLWIADPTATLTWLTVNGTGTLTATFTASLELAVNFVVEGSGSVTWNVNQDYTGTSTNDTVAPGAYSIAPLAAAHSTFNGWNTTGGVTITTLDSLNALGEWVLQYELTVSGAGTVYASFVGQTFPVTFVDDPSATGTVATFTGTGPGVPVRAGNTGNFAAGMYAVTLSGGAIPAAHWAATSNLTLSATTGLTVSVTVSGSGTLYALAIALPVVTGVTVYPSVVEPDVPFTVNATVAGGTNPFTFNISAAATLAPGTLSCIPGVFVSLWNTNSSVCTATTVGTFTLYGNVTDLIGYAGSGSTSIEVVGGPAIGFTTPVAHAQMAGQVLSVAASWTNTIASGALPGLEETVALVDDSTGLVVTNTPSVSNVGAANLLVPAGATNSVSITASDLLGPYASGLPPAQYSVRVTAYRYERARTERLPHHRGQHEPCPLHGGQRATPDPGERRDVLPRDRDPGLAGAGPRQFHWQPPAGLRQARRLRGQYQREHRSARPRRRHRAGHSRPFGSVLRESDHLQQGRARLGQCFGDLPGRPRVRPAHPVSQHHGGAHVHLRAVHRAVHRGPHRGTSCDVGRHSGTTTTPHRDDDPRDTDHRRSAWRRVERGELRGPPRVGRGPGAASSSVTGSRDGSGQG